MPAKKESVAKRTSRILRHVETKFSKMGFIKAHLLGGAGLAYGPAAARNQKMKDRAKARKK